MQFTFQEELEMMRKIKPKHKDSIKQPNPKLSMKAKTKTNQKTSQCK
jgi:hypothetical protein